MDREAQSRYDRQINKYSKAIKNCLFVYVEDIYMLCFEYQKRRYIADGHSLSTIYLYDPDTPPRFSPALYLSENEFFLEVIYTKFYHSLENGNSIGDDFGEVEYATISKTRQQFIEIIELAKTEKFPL